MPPKRARPGGLPEGGDNAVRRQTARHTESPYSHPRASFSDLVFAERVTGTAGVPKIIIVPQNADIQCREHRRHGICLGLAYRRFHRLK
jgi:hypothetical protein